MASNSNLPPNSRMIIDLLMKNAAKYNDEEYVGGDDTIFLQKQKLQNFLLMIEKRRKRRKLKKGNLLKMTIKERLMKSIGRLKLKWSQGKKLKLNTQK